MFDLIAFDADDTLWENEYLYKEGRARFQEVLRKFTHPQESGKRLDEIEVDNIQWYGYGIKSFVLSMLEAAIEVSNAAIPAQELREILEIAHRMIEEKVRLYDDTVETLATLEKQYALMLITKGDTWEQYRKIQKSGVMNFFRYIEIVPNKTEKTYKHLLTKYHINPSRFLMVGNSLRSDVLPVVNIGGQAVFIPKGSTWAHEHVTENERRQIIYAELSHLGELPSYLASVISD